jgi:Curli production assembly/transport component CsgG
MKLIFEFVIHVFLLLGISLFTSAVALAQNERPAVGIVEMTDLANSGQADRFSTMIETAMVSSNRFRVIERQRMARLMEEQARGRGGVVTTNRPGRTGGFEGVDYLIYGTITSISAVDRADIGTSFLTGVLGGSQNQQQCRSTRVRMEADIRITDTNTGEVRYATRISEQQNSATVCSGGTQIDSGALLRAAADNIVTGLITAIYPIQVAQVMPDGTMLLNSGEGSLARGDYLFVYGPEMEIPNPAGGTMRIDGERLGAIQVTDVQSAFSRAERVSAFTQDPPFGAVVRKAEPDDIEQLQRSQRRRR